MDEIQNLYCYIEIITRITDTCPSKLTFSKALSGKITTME